MKVGDLVQVKPALGTLYMITSLDAYDWYNRRLPKAVMLVNLDDFSELPCAMDKKWIKMISKATKKRTKKKEST